MEQSRPVFIINFELSNQRGQNTSLNDLTCVELSMCGAFLMFSLLFLVYAPSIVGLILSGGSVVNLVLVPVDGFCVCTGLGYFRLCSVLCSVFR